MTAVRALVRRPFDLPPAATGILVLAFLSDLGQGLVLPFLAVYVARVRGQGVVLGSLTVSALAAASLVANVLAGRLLDRRGAVAVLAGGWLLAAAAEVSLLLSDTRPGLLLSAAGMGAAAGCSYPALRSLLARASTPAQRGLLFGVRHGLFNLALAGGALISALVLLPATLFRFQALYLVDAASFVVAAALLLVLVRPTLPAPAREPVPVDADGGRPVGYRTVLGDRRFRTVCSIQALVVLFSYAQYHSALPLVLSRSGGLSASAIAVVYMVNAGTVVLAAVPAAVGVRRLSRPAGIAAGAALLAVCWACIGAAVPWGGAVPALVLCAAGAAAMGMGEAVLAATLDPLSNDLAPEHLRGRYNSVDAAVLSAGTIAGPALTAAVLASTGPVALLAVLVAGCLAAAVSTRRLARSSLGAFPG